MRRFLICSVFIFPLLLCTQSEKLYAFTGDTLSNTQLFRESKPRTVRNYIRPCVYLNYFTTGSRPTHGVIDPFHDRALDARLGNYKFSQSNLGFYVPLYTHTRFAGQDSSDVNTFHLLMTMNGLSSMPEFSGLDKQHKLYKIGLGVRAIYGFGSKFVLFVDASPYVTGDKYDSQQTQQFRFASSVLMNVMVDPAFSFRFGVTKTQLYGNKYLLPMAGIRIGRLDSKFYFSFQFPRYTSFNFQPTPKLSFSLYSKAYGGLYNMSNTDSIYVGRDSVIQFGQRGFANGIRFDYRTGPDFSFFVSSGFSVNNTISFYSFTFNHDQQQMHPFHALGPFYKGRPDPALFVNVGVSWRFGKAKKSSGNYLMYDIFSINNDMDPGDNNAGPGNGDITPQQKKDAMKNVQYKDVKDLIEDTDLY